MHKAGTFYNLKLGLAVGSFFVPFIGCTHQVIEARIPEIRHDVMAPPKRVQLVLLHGGLNLEGGFTKEEINTHTHTHVKDNSTIYNYDYNLKRRTWLQFPEAMIRHLYFLT